MLLDAGPRPLYPDNVYVYKFSVQRFVVFIPRRNFTAFEYTLKKTKQKNQKAPIFFLKTFPSPNPYFLTFSIFFPFTSSVLFVSPLPFIFIIIFCQYFYLYFQKLQSWKFIPYKLETSNFYTSSAIFPLFPLIFIYNCVHICISAIYQKLHFATCLTLDMCYVWCLLSVYGRCSCSCRPGIPSWVYLS